MLFLKVKDTNFESNSQLILIIAEFSCSCFWKSKIQILKAIHNLALVVTAAGSAVSESQRYKFWKQFTTPPPDGTPPRTAVSESQRYKFWKQFTTFLSLKPYEPLAVSESQRYKFWKQFTTHSEIIKQKSMLFLKVKDTNFESNSQLRHC